MMKLTALLLLAGSLTAHADSHAQVVSIFEKNVPLTRIFRAIEKQTGYTFVYRKVLVQNAKKVTVNLRDAPLAQVLDVCFQDQPLSYSVLNNIIVIKEKKAVVRNDELPFEAIAVRGRVENEKGEPLGSATVTEKGTQNSVKTNDDGSFFINVGSTASILIASFVGYETKEVRVAGQTYLTISLTSLEQQMSDVVVVGYGTQNKKNVTGAVEQITSKDLENKPVTSVTEVLQGMIGNLNVENANGEPGSASNSNFNIRGYTSINGGSPLILVDGVEMEVNLINPADIKSVTVLKDAGSAAIYGSRAAFGVLLIETKTGKDGGKTEVSYKTNLSFRRPTIMPDLIENSYDQAVAVNQALFNSGGTYQFSDRQLAGIKAYYEDPVNNPAWAEIDGNFEFYGYTDWRKELMRDYAPTQQHTLTLSGGSGKTNFYTSLGYLNQEGLFLHGNDSYQKLNASLHVNNQTFPWLKTRFKAAYNHTATDKPHGYASRVDVVNSILNSSPVMPIRYEGSNENYVGRYFNSPAGYQELAGRDGYKVNHVLLNAGVTATINKYFQVIGDFTYNIYRNAESKYTKKIPFLNTNFTTEYGETNNDNLFLGSYNTDYYSLNAYAQYERTIHDDLYLKGMAGFSQELSDASSFTSQHFNLINVELPSMNLATGDQRVDGGYIQWALRGAFYRLNLGFKDRYLLEFNGRYDGSSRFPGHSRFGFFPSFSGGWRISEEHFMEGLKPFLQSLKLRASYGTLGNQSISFRGQQQFYPYIPSMSSGNTTFFLFNNVTDLLMNPPGLVSPSLTWERATTLDYGLDIGILNDRLQASFDWYRRTTSQMLIRVQYPQILGADSPAQNAAELETTGWELSLQWQSTAAKRFNYTFKLILSDNQAVITKYDNPSGSLNDWYVGKKVGERWGYETGGIFQTDEEVTKSADQSQIGANWKAGDIRYADLNGDGYINEGARTLDDPGDLKVISYETPRYSFGFHTDLSYGNLFANIFLQGIGKRDYWPGFDGFWPFSSQYFQVQKSFVTDSWSEDNPDAYFSRPLARELKNRLPQSRFVQNAAYIRLKTLTVGYNLPESFISRIGIAKAQVYFSGYNLWESTKMRSTLDPELNLGLSGTALGYPFQRAYSLGINITF